MARWSSGTATNTALGMTRFSLRRSTTLSWMNWPLRSISRNPMSSNAGRGFIRRDPMTAFTEAPEPGVRLVMVTSGTGASTGFAIAEETMASLMDETG